jgi:hypothetical protein
MKQAFEAVWEQGKILPLEAVSINDHTRLLVVVIDEPGEQVPTSGWRTLKGKYKGKLSSVDEFIQQKQEEKRLER